MNGLRISFFLILLASFSACGGGKGAQTQVVAEQEAVATDVTEVLYFHGKQRCITCNAIERLTRQVVDSLASDKVVMRIVDLSMPEHEPLADRYEVAFSSLIIARDGETENLTDMAFSYAKGEPELFKAKLVESIVQIAP